MPLDGKALEIEDTYTATEHRLRIEDKSVSENLIVTNLYAVSV